MKKHVVDLSEISLFNKTLQLKNLTGKTVSRNEIIKILKLINYKSDSIISKILNVCFQRTERGKYFIPSEPIHISKLQQCYDERHKAYKPQQMPIDQAIATLKANNYIIYKRRFNVEEALKFPKQPVENFITEEKI